MPEWAQKTAREALRLETLDAASWAERIADALHCRAFKVAQKVWEKCPSQTEDERKNAFQRAWIAGSMAFWLDEAAHQTKRDLCQPQLYGCASARLTFLFWEQIWRQKKPPK